MNAVWERMSIPMSETTNQQRTSNVSFERERGVYGLRVTKDVAHASIDVGSDTLRSSRTLQVFKVLSEGEVPVFLIKIHASAVTLAFAGTDLAKAEKVLKDAGFISRPRRDLALIAIHAASMRELPGIMSQIADCLYAASAKLYEIGDSHESVLCLIEGGRVPAVISALCKHFSLDPSDVVEESVELEERF